MFKHVSSNYLHCVFNLEQYQKVIEKLASDIATFKYNNKVRIDAIAIRGMSGALVGGALSAATGIPLLCIRKGRQSHSYCRVEGVVNADDKGVMNYVIVDDLICSGGTVNAIIRDVKKDLKDYGKVATTAGKLNKLTANLVGIFLYNDGEQLPWTDNVKKPVPVWSFQIRSETKDKGDKL